MKNKNNLKKEKIIKERKDKEKRKRKHCLKSLKLNTHDEYEMS
jgi:hypothetical protein